MGTAADLTTLVVGPLTLLGIVLAWVQLRRTANAAAAAEEAARRTSHDLATYQLLTLISAAQQIEAQLDAAIQDENRGRVIDLMTSWKQAGTEIRGLLDARTTLDNDLDRLLTQSFALATQTKGVLLDGQAALLDNTSRIREAIGGATGRLGVLSGQLKANMGGNQ